MIDDEKGIQIIESLHHNINCNLLDRFKENLTSPIIGIIFIRKILSEFGIVIPFLYELDQNGSEFVIEIPKPSYQHDLYDIPQIEDNHYLYVVYFKDDDGRYKFHSEITDSEGLRNIFLEDDEEANL